jgi:hypothetical protein
LKPTTAHTADCLTQIEQLTARLRTLEPILRHRAEDTALDGYPRQSGPGGGSGRGDPVGVIVAIRLDHPDWDTLATTYTDVTTKLHRARRLLEQAESAGRRALPPPPAQNFDDGCLSCARIKTWSPIHRTRRCRWCSDWAYQHDGDDPPIGILRAHHEGRRITTRLIASVTTRRYR